MTKDVLQTTTRNYSVAPAGRPTSTDPDHSTTLAMALMRAGMMREQADYLAPSEGVD
jgi:hypothetical protein